MRVIHRAAASHKHNVTSEDSDNSAFSVDDRYA